MDNKKPALGSTIANAVQTTSNLVRNIASLICTEAQLAGKSLIQIILLSALARSFLSTAWLFSCALMVVYFLSLKLSLFVSLISVILLNLIFATVVYLMILDRKKYLSFQATRRQFDSPQKDSHDE